MKLAAISVVLFLVLLSSATSNGDEKEPEFGYKKGTKTGPENWGRIRNDWITCGKGKSQSPIDLGDKMVRRLQRLRRFRTSYVPADAAIKNRGHDIAVIWNGDEAGGITINRTEYKLKQLHWHSPSEHSINRRRFSLEMHMVHQSADNKTAVVGILYKTGLPDPFIHKLERSIKKVKDKTDKEEELGAVDPSHASRRMGQRYYRYMGSLTTPPCSEGVIWTILRKVKTVSKKQLRLLRRAVDDDYENNSRPRQPINGRLIGLYRPPKHEN
ncbi:carbonic anhydrase [Musa troglodytarum]|uniref:Carbonic anhydrase n=1 Tax=Musa troglodytarum TaxID=320322 RepID=A0A9E7KE07_9LILI|nr:carbonic anhydrase [Musa troglodytarum]